MRGRGVRQYKMLRITGHRNSFCSLEECARVRSAEKVVMPFLICFASASWVGQSSAQQPGSPAYNNVFLPAHGAGDVQRARGISYWGALATGKPVGTGFVVGMWSEEEAKQFALNECNENGGVNCEIRQTFYNSCAAVARGSNHWGFGAGEKVSLKELRRLALSECKGGDCTIYRAECVRRR